MFKNVYSLYSAFFTHPAFYSQYAVCILHSVCILPLVRSLQSAVRSVRFTLTDFAFLYIVFCAADSVVSYYTYNVNHLLKFLSFQES